ncbi:MAG: 2-phospho-L-lactate transferase CofD family protein [Vicinamibacterales bacterium]
MRVVLFSGGRGSGVLSKQLVNDPRIQLTLAINGYDDGASTGEVRRFLGDSLGPSDYRKNASRLALELGSCPASLVELLDTRLPEGVFPDAALATLRRLSAGVPTVSSRLEAFIHELTTSGRSFDFSDCSVGNLVFAGSFVMSGRNFNAAVDDYCGLLALPLGLIENVTDGTNAYLVAIAADETVLGSEEEIVGAAGSNRIKDIYLIDRALSDQDRARLATGGPDRAATLFESHQVVVGLNARLAARLAEADLIIYAPGTQHSSLFPSYLTPGLSRAIARNLRAIKLLITNIQADAEIAGGTAVDIIERALYYLQEKNTVRTPTPCLITHCIVNEPGKAETSVPYVPLGHIGTLEDPRLVRIANYEDGVTGRHDATKILGPFIQSFLQRRSVQRIAVLLHDAGSLQKVVQSILEMVRGGIADLPVDVTVFYEGEPLDAAFVSSLPVRVRALQPSMDAGTEEQFRRAIADAAFDYVVLFESSGMYRGEDVVGLASHLTAGRLDAVWGSRRLSVRDIQESYRLRYRHKALLGAISYVGSHLLSLSCLVLYGRYISDTLSAVRAVRAADAIRIELPLTHKRANHHLLGRLLRRRAEILEIPVQFFPISPERVKRTSALEGLQSLGALVGQRLRTPRAPRIEPEAPIEPAEERRTNPVPSR